MLVSEKRSVGNNGCLRHTLMPEAAATLGRVHTSSKRLLPENGKSRLPAHPLRSECTEYFLGAGSQRGT